MADGVTISVDSIELTRALKMWKRELGAAYPDFLRSESRKALQQIIKDTPPRSLARERKEISADLGNTFGMLKLTKSPGLMKLVRKKDFAALTRIFASFKGGPLKGKRVARFDAARHKPFKANFRKVSRRRTGEVTPDWREWKRFRRVLWKRLGWLKAGWMQSANRLNVKAPQWARKHTAASAAADYQEFFSDKEAFVSMQNREVRFPLKGYQFLVERALFRRARSMEGLLKRLVQGKAAKVGFVTKGGAANTVTFNE